MLEKIKNFKWGYAVLFLVLVGIGICLISLRQTLTALAITIGVLLSLVGVTLMIIELARKERSFAFGARILFYVACIVCGVVTAIFRDGAVDVMISIFSLLLIIDASFKLHTTAMSKRYSVPLWWIILAFAVLTVIGGFFALKYPPEKLEATSVLLGIVFILDGVSNLLSAFYIAAYERRQYDEHYYEFYNREIAPGKTDEEKTECELTEAAPSAESYDESPPEASVSEEDEKIATEEENDADTNSSSEEDAEDAEDSEDVKEDSTDNEASEDSESEEG